MQVQCTKCSQPIALTDIIEAHNGHLAHRILRHSRP